MPTKSTTKTSRSKRASAARNPEEACNATSDVSPDNTPARRTSSRAQGRASAPRSAIARRKKVQANSDVSEDDQDDGSEDAYEEDVDEVASKTYDSDALDDDEEMDMKSSAKKRKRASRASPKKAPSKSTRKKRKVEEDEDEEEEEFELKEGQEIVGEVVQAPKTGRVPPGQVSKNTLDFLTKLSDPKCNDREWFKLNELVYRQAEKEWKDFVEHFTDLLIEVDSQIPPLPPKDVIHRIYRDIRFSNDKTPYKRNFSASFSRSGRKGIFAGYHIMIKPGGESLIAAGTWCPGKNELATIRSNIIRNSTRLREVISAPAFIKFFGEPRPSEDGEKRNIFGSDDELKVAPKGIDKTHKDIALLKCRSFFVIHRFMDSEVLSPDFNNKLAEVAGVTQPFVHCLNDMMTIQDHDDDDDDG